MLEKDLPKWVFCRQCYVFHPAHKNEKWKLYSDRIMGCKQLDGHVYFNWTFIIPFERARMVMNQYRSERSEKSEKSEKSHVHALHRLSNVLKLSDTHTKFEAVTKAEIVGDGLIFGAMHKLFLYSDWNVALVQRNLFDICHHVRKFQPHF